MLRLPSVVLRLPFTASGVVKVQRTVTVNGDSEPTRVPAGRSVVPPTPGQTGIVGFVVVPVQSAAFNVLFGSSTW